MIKKNTEKDLIKIYYNELKKIPLLNREEVIELAKKSKKGNKDATNKLIVSNLRFVVKISKNYAHWGLPFEDLISEGNIGLIKAIERYDHTKSAISTYSSFWIKKEITQAIYNKTKIIRVPVRGRNKISKIRKTIDEYFLKNRHYPSIKEISKDTEIPLEEIRNLYNYLNEPKSLDKKAKGENKRSYYEIINEGSKIEESTFKRINPLETVINEILDETLSEKEKDVIKSRFGLNEKPAQKLPQIAKRYCMTVEGMRLVQNRALKKLRETKKNGILKDYIFD
jgi:RNA polymerase primary sigma factor